jgi:putative two-component system response regulator
VTLINRFLEDKVRERTEEVRETQLEVIRRLGTAAEFRDDVTGAHIYRMSQYCNVLALGAGLDAEAAEELLTAAPMHDIGKIGVPDHVLLKPGKLDDEEWDIMRAHTVMGAQILSGSTSSSIRLARQIALEHHERWDGRGYPTGLAGEDISLEARICSIADVLDALTSTRPYKKPWTFDDALAEIDNSRGTMFDPELVEVFVGQQDEVRAIYTASVEGTLGEPNWRVTKDPADPADTA